MSEWTFENTGERIVVLDDERYLRIKTYCTSDGTALASLSDEQFTAMLMEQPFYDHVLIGRPGYDEGRDGWKQGSGQHGPYALDRLSPDLYERISEEAFRRRLEAHYEDPFYEEEGPVREDAVTEIDRFLDGLPLSACRILSLEINFGSSKADEYFDEPPLHSDFHEYILVEEECFHFFIVAWD
jgi:hypothetical protein